jgi:hypothetical protein
MTLRQGGAYCQGFIRKRKPTRGVSSPPPDDTSAVHRSPDRFPPVGQPHTQV